MLKDFLDKQIEKCSTDLLTTQSRTEKWHIQGALDAYLSVKIQMDKEKGNDKVTEKSPRKAKTSVKSVPETAAVEKVSAEGVLSLITCPAEWKNNIYEYIMSNQIEMLVDMGEGKFKKVGEVGAGIQGVMCFFKGEIDKFAPAKEIDQYFVHPAFDQGKIEFILNKVANESQLKVTIK